LELCKGLTYDHHITKKIIGRQEKMQEIENFSGFAEKLVDLWVEMEIYGLKIGEISAAWSY